MVIALVRQPPARPISRPIDRIISNFTSIADRHQGDIEVEVTIDNLEEDENQSSGKRPRFCAKCGGPVQAQFKFCEYCGAKIRDV